ncbi:MAG: YesL family protein [Eubacteriales bacterium]|nr:YesL family protein [Eubacteriales bacterium]
MLAGFFNYDNPVWRFIGKFFDIMILNLLWVVCSIPIVTMGASTTAVYYVTMKLVRDEDSSTIRSFFKSFKENFRQATIIWLILLAAGCLIGFDLYFFMRVRTDASMFRTVMLAVFLGFALIWLCITLFVFPLQAKFYNPVRRTIFNAFFMSIRHFLHSLGMIAVDVLMVALALFVPWLMAVMTLFGFPLFAFVNSCVFVSVFDKYIPKQEEEQRTDGDVWELPEDAGKTLAKKDE